MPIVTDTLLKRLGQQIKDRGTVVWYDPQRDYAGLAEALQPVQVAGAAVHRYDPARGFVWLRHQLEPLWGPATEPPSLLIYVPLDPSATDGALIEYEAAGVRLRPGQQPPERDTSLAAIARAALADVLPPAALAKTLAEVEAGKWTLAELDQAAERGIEERAGVLKLLFGSGALADIALGFLTNPAVDAELHHKQALPNLAAFLEEALGVALPAQQGAAGLRAALARLLLATDLQEALDKDAPPALATFPAAEQPLARQAAAQLAHTWRNRRDLAASYGDWAGQVEQALQVGQLSLPLDALGRCETFLALETALQEAVETKLALHGASPATLALARGRLQGFWAGQEPEVKARWQVIEAAGRVLEEASRVEAALKGKTWNAASLLAGYATGDAPWYLLDTAQRHLEREVHSFDVDPGQHDGLIKLVNAARQRYTLVADSLAERFVKAYAAAGFAVPGVLQQVDIYSKEVAPRLAQGRTAFVLVDALRFEMAAELQRLAAALDPAWQATLTPALASAPTVTEVGMASLMPGAEQGLTVVEGKAGKLLAVVAGVELKDRSKRVEHWSAAIKAPAEVVKLAELAPLTSKSLDKKLRAAQAILVTATEEIDGLGETNPALARRMLDDALNQLRRGVKALFNLGVQHVVITADHGYLFGEKLTEGEGIDAPGGQTAVLKRRVWVGKGGDSIAGVLRKPLSAFGVGGDLELATPQNLSCFKAAGSNKEYFHGGLSLPEVVIPLLVIQSQAKPAAGMDIPIHWTVTLGSKIISTRFVSVTVSGSGEGLLAVQPPAVRAEVRAGGQVISTPVAASYGFDELAKDVHLRPATDAQQQIEPNTLTLMIVETPDVKHVTVHLLDASTGLSLAQVNQVPFSIFD